MNEDSWLSDESIAEALENFKCEMEDECPGCQLRAALELLVYLESSFSHSERCEDEECERHQPEEFVHHFSKDNDDALHLIARCGLAIQALTHLQRAAAFLVAMGFIESPPWEDEEDE